MELSGSQWVSRFPASASTADLVQPFRASAERFIAAMRAAGLTVILSATLRPQRRAFLMHWSWAIARMGQDPATVPSTPGVDIDWVHKKASGGPDAAASRAAAEAMVVAYGIVFQPSLTSRHTAGKAVDVTISWTRDTTIQDGLGHPVALTGAPRNGQSNATLHRVGASYAVLKLVSDAPHWSADGH